MLSGVRASPRGPYGIAVVTATLRLRMAAARISGAILWSGQPRTDLWTPGDRQVRNPAPGNPAASLANWLGPSSCRRRADGVARR
jgi:hypothetical protein